MQKNRCMIVPALLLAAALAFPAASRSEERMPEPALHAGAWALQFQIDDNFTLSPFQGAILSVKRHHSDRSAFRVALGLSLATEDIDATLAEMDTVTSSEARDESSQYVRLDVQYLRYTDPGSPVKLLFGFGPLFTFSNGDAEVTRETGSVKTESTAWMAGVSGLVGAEWFATDTISLHAEYGIEMTYRWTKATSTTNTTSTLSSETTRHTGNIHARGVLFGLSAYF